MANDLPPQKSGGNFKRKLSGKGITILLVFILIVVAVAGKIVSEITWNSYLVKNEPRIALREMIRDLQRYAQKNKEFPDNLAMNHEDINWKWMLDKQGNKPNVDRTGVTKSGLRSISRFRYKNYEYLYADLSNKEDGALAVIWAIPVWEITPPGNYLRYTGYNLDLSENLEEWTKIKKTYYVILNEKKYFVWENVLPRQDKGTFGLEKYLEPTPEWLKEKNLFQNFAERF